MADLREESPRPPRVEAQVYRLIVCPVCKDDKPFVIQTKERVRYYQCREGDCGERFKIPVQRPEEDEHGGR